MKETTDKLYSVRFEGQRACQWPNAGNNTYPLRVWVYMWQRSEIFIVW
jgi:hypothetical protein